MKERSLVLFTLMSQIAVGVFLSSTGFQIVYAFRPATSNTSDSMIIAHYLLMLVLSLVLISASLLASIAHLGSPRRAWRAATNLRTSWLSREIVFGLLFAVFLSLLIFAYSIPSILPATLYTSLACCIVCSLAFIYSMARVYMQRTIPAWNRAHTVLSFFLTSCGFGLLLTALVLSLFAAQSDAWIRNVIYVACGAAASTLVLQVLIRVPTRLSFASEVQLQQGQHVIWYFPERLKQLGLLCILLASIAALLPLWLPGQMGSILLISVTLALLGETITRFAFYAVYRRVGI